MNNYKEIIERIKKIINFSNLRYMEANEEEKKHGFTYILHIFIDNEQVAELQRLLELEEMAYELQQTNCLQLNLELIAIIGNNSKYLELSNILNKALDSKIIDLVEYNGYFVRKEDYYRFLILCHNFQLGPYSSLIALGSENAKAKIEENLNKRKNQEQRIFNYLNLEKKKNEIVKLFDSKVYQIVILGVSGKLTKDMIALYKNEMSSDEYRILLNELFKWQVIDKKEFDELNNIKVLDNVDDLVTYFARKKNLNVEVLRLLIPSIGEIQYGYLMDELFKLNAISLEDYLKDLKYLIHDTNNRNI